MVSLNIDPTLTAQVEAMKSVGWLGQLPRAVVQKLVENALVVRFDKGDYLYRPDDPPGGIYGIIRGATRVEISTNETPSQLIGCFQAGAWTGQSPSLDGSNRMTGFSAVDEVVALHLPLAKIRELAQSDPRVTEAIGTLSVWNLNLALKAVGELTIRRADQRIATRLLGISNYPLGIAGEDGWQVPLNQSEIAEIACASRHNVNKAVGEFRRHGWLKLRGKTLIITDPESVQGFANAAME